MKTVEVICMTLYWVCELIFDYLDWDDELPEKDFNLAEIHLKKADLVLCLGTSLR
jgi:hypothetical protein